MKYALLFILWAWPATVYANVQMTEIYPAPSGGYEWIELCNNSENSIQSSEYTLYDSAGNTLFIPSQMLFPGEYLIATASSVLNNAGDTVFLEHQKNLIQTATYSERITHEQSYILCNNVWSITDITSPGKANPECAVALPTNIPSTIPTISTRITYSSTTAQPSPKVLITQHPSDIITPQLFRAKHTGIGKVGTMNTPTINPTRTPIPPIEVETWTQKFTRLGVWLAIAMSSIPAVYYGSVLYKKYQSQYNGDTDYEHKSHPT